MPPAAYAAIETDLPGGSLRQAGRHAGCRILAPHPDLLSNSLSRGRFRLTAASGRQAESSCSGTTLSGFFHAFASEDTHDA
jgi:hypothetical protein